MTFGQATGAGAVGQPKPVAPLPSGAASTADGDRDQAFSDMTMTDPKASPSMWGNVKAKIGRVGPRSAAHSHEDAATLSGSGNELAGIPCPHTRGMQTHDNVESVEKRRDNRRPRRGVDLFDQHQAIEGHAQFTDCAQSEPGATHNGDPRPLPSGLGDQRKRQRERPGGTMHGHRDTSLQAGTTDQRVQWCSDGQDTIPRECEWSNFGEAAQKFRARIQQ